MRPRGTTWLWADMHRLGTIWLIFTPKSSWPLIGKVRFLRKDEYVRSIIEEFGSVMNLGQKRWISLVFCIKYFPVWGIGKWRVHSSASSPKIYSSFIVGGQLWLAPSPIIISWKSFQQSKALPWQGSECGVRDATPLVIYQIGFCPVIRNLCSGKTSFLSPEN